MTGRKLQDSNKLRDLVKDALEKGHRTPTAVENYVSQVKPRGLAAPAPATINRIMKELNYEPAEGDWIKKG